MISEHGAISSSETDSSVSQTVAMVERYSRGVCSLSFEQSTWREGSMTLTLKSDGLKAEVEVHDNVITALINALCRVKDWEPKKEEEDASDV